MKNTNYKILSLICDNNLIYLLSNNVRFGITSHQIEECYECNINDGIGYICIGDIHLIHSVKIYSVQRLIDNVIFKVGDTLTARDFDNTFEQIPFVIKEINITDGRVWFKGIHQTISLTNAHSSSKKDIIIISQPKQGKSYSFPTHRKQSFDRNEILQALNKSLISKQSKDIIFNYLNSL